MRIFVCYRREDSQHQAGRLYDKLEQEYGAKSVFKDVDSVPVGSDFRLVLRSAIERCDIVLVLIGDAWIDIADDSGKRRIEDPDDFVRIEIEWALKRNIPVVPVLVGSKSMPSRDELPISIHSFAFRHGVALRPDPFFRNDVGQLINQLNTSLQTGAGELESVDELDIPIELKRRLTTAEPVLPPPPPAANCQPLVICNALILILAVVGIIYAMFVVFPKARPYGESGEIDAETISHSSLWMYFVCYTPILLSLLLSLTAIVGAISSLQNRRYTMAVIGAYAVMIPFFSPLYGIGFPLGVWTLVLLQHPFVRATFK